MVIPFMTIYLNQELNFSLGTCAFIMSCFGLGSVCGSFIGGILTDRLGFFKVMYSSLLMSSVCFVLMMFMSTLLQLTIGIFILALIYELFRPANLTAIEAYSKKENLTRSLGLVRLAVNLGYAVGPFMGGIVAATLGFEFLFVFNGLAIFIGGVTFYNLFKNKKHRTTTIELSESERKSLQMPWSDFRYLAYLFFFTLTIIVFMQFLYTVPLFFKTEYKFDEMTIGAFMGLNGALIAIFEMPMLYVIEKKWEPVICVVIGSLFMGFGFFVFTFIPDAYLAAVIFCLFTTFGEMLSFPFSNNYAMSFSNDHNRGKYMGLYTMTFSMAHVVGPYLGLSLAQDVGYNLLWIGSMGLCAFGAVMIFLTRKVKA